MPEKVPGGAQAPSVTRVPTAVGGGWEEIFMPICRWVSRDAK